MSYTAHMTPKTRSVTIRVDEATDRAMRELQARYGTPYSEQVRRALTIWLRDQGVLKTERPRAATRTRS
ncbi:MAG: hypothetical protein KJ066_16225 [Acidobacteria bacterium]|nr:hypothetical protein [Acidobacteriota bacterium]